MVLTFKKPPETIVLERGRDEAKRVVRAVQGDNPKRWDLTLQHPSGEAWKGTFYGDPNTVQVAMVQMMMDKETNFIEDAGRGHQPRGIQLDRNVPVNDGAEAAIRPIPGRNTR